jgi:hypothetical protein
VNSKCNGENRGVGEFCQKVVYTRRMERTVYKELSNFYLPSLSYVAIDKTLLNWLMINNTMQIVIGVYWMFKQLCLKW